MSNIANTAISTNATFTSTTVSTVAAANNSGSGGGSGLSMVQYAFLSIIVGLVIEISFTGIIAITMRLFKKEGSNNFWKIAWLMLFFNTYAVSKRSGFVLYCIVMIVLHRAVWTGWDIAKSTGVYDPETDICAYYQYPLSGFGYNAADLICDAFCMVVSIGFSFQYLFTSFGKLGEMIPLKGTKEIVFHKKNLSNNLILQARPAMVHFQRMSNSANISVSSNSTITSATNSTLATADGSGSGGGGGSGLSIPQYAFLSIIVGLVIEISFTGIITILLRLFKKGGSKNFWKVASLMLFFNVWCIVYMVFFTLSFFAAKENCVVINTMSNISSQFFYVTYDLFMLYKTYAVSRNNRVVLYCIFVIVAHRAVWTGWDIAKSTGVYDPETDVCAYYQYPLSGFGYNAADLICDAFCTVVAIGFNCQFLFTSFGKLGEMIVKDNVLRSVLILSVNSYLLYVNLNVSDLMTILVAYMLQNYMYTRALNAEMFWAEERKIASVISRSGANSTSKFNTSSSAVKSAA
ncbi:hypothetical protein CcCBS67573_g10065 [Chytriomyces confervae]|uniref:Uncharacterized protein n=1 Tax=Chytriomyces confervae TaxID=246404 RepID=A0A507DH08_9FUNG|nr:hypothetical protein CcCBS67573_g10065 [Chytriomyces confervae]